MGKKLFVGNLDWGITDQELQQVFAQFGDVEEAVIVKDKFSGRSKGFGFITFKDDEQADKAIAGLNNSELKGRKIIVNEARPPKARTPNNKF